MEYTIDCALIADARQFHRTLAQVAVSSSV